MASAAGAERRAPLARGKRAAWGGIVVNALLAAVKMVAGVLGNSYALIADAVESSADVLSSTIVLGGLQVAGREPDDQYPFGYGKAETLAGAVVALMLFGAAGAIAIQAIREIRTPHHMPEWWTLVVLAMVMAVKGLLARRVSSIGKEIGSTAVRTDAWHHLGDALTSAAAFIGILVAVIGGVGWESADDWAALAASGVIAVNAALLLRPTVADLMDRSPDPDVLQAIRSTASAVPGVLAIEKIAARRVGLSYRAIVHVQADPGLSLRDAHALGHQVTAVIQRNLGQVQAVVVHMEPFDPGAKRGSPSEASELHSALVVGGTGPDVPGGSDPTRSL